MERGDKENPVQSSPYYSEYNKTSTLGSILEF